MFVSAVLKGDIAIKRVFPLIILDFIRIFDDCEVRIENSVTMVTVWYHAILYETRHEKTNKISVRTAKTDQPGHLPSLIRVFAVRPMGS